MWLSEALLQFGGRLHPMVLHAPIGILIGLITLELIARMRGKPMAKEVRAALAWLAAITAGVAVGSGLLLAEEGDNPLKTVQLHQWLGIATAVVMALAAILSHWTRAVRAYAALMIIAVMLLIPTGHFGASMTHGEGYLTEPFEVRDQGGLPRVVSGGGTPSEGGAGRANPAATGTYALVIAPILADKCISCHGEKKQKGNLALHTPEAINAGGDLGSVLVPGDPSASELVVRLRLPIDDEDHMPPEAKPQLTEDEIKAIEKWIADGAKFEGGEAAIAAKPPTAAVEPAKVAAPKAASPATIEALKARLVHVEPVSQGSPLLVVDFSAVARDVGDEDVKSLLTPLREQIADLTLARSKISDAVMETITAMPLRRLSLAATAVGDAGIARLAKAATLEELVLTQTKVTDESLAVIAELPRLRQVYLWKSGVTSAGAASLREKRPSLVADIGDSAAAAVLEAEQAVKLSGDAPVPGAPAPAVATADLLKPINVTCPVSGKPVDANFAIVFKGKVVGFCCRDCIGQFLEEPAKFEGKIN